MSRSCQATTPAPLVSRCPLSPRDTSRQRTSVDGVHPIAPPIFIRGEDRHIFRPVEAAESSLEPVDVEPGEIGFDPEGRLLNVLVRGQGKRRWFGID